MRPQLVIPMTGISSRFTAAGYDRPKALIEVDGQTVIDHVVDMFPGWDDVLFLCNADHLADPRLGLRERLLARRPSATVVEVPAHKLGPATPSCRRATTSTATARSSSTTATSPATGTPTTSPSS